MLRGRGLDNFDRSSKQDYAGIPLPGAHNLISRTASSRAVRESALLIRTGQHPGPRFESIGPRPAAGSTPYLLRRLSNRPRYVQGLDRSFLIAIPPIGLVFAQEYRKSGPGLPF